MNDRRWLLWGAWVILGLLLVGNGGFRQMLKGYFDARRLERTLTDLEADHARLQHEWALLQKDPTHTDYLIRKNLKYIKKDETEYRVPPVP